MQQLGVSSGSRAKHSDGIGDDNTEHYDEKKNDAGTARRQWFKELLSHQGLLSIPEPPAPPEAFLLDVDRRQPRRVPTSSEHRRRLVASQTPSGEFRGQRSAKP